MRKLITVISVLLTLVSCSKEKQPQQPAQPAGYTDLYAAYKAGLSYIDISQDNTYTTITMEDKSTVALRLADIAVYDCRESSPATTAIDENGEWMLGGRKLGIWVDNSKCDADAVPIYIYYTKEELHVRLSNHGEFFLKYMDPEFVGDIPIIYLTTKNSQEIWSKEEYVEGTFRLEDPDEKFEAGKVVTSAMKIRGRGNSTWGMPKKPYKVKFDEKLSFFGLDKDKEWCLLANYTDKSLVRNLVAMEISRICDMAWTPEMKSCEVYLNGKYQGVYTFSEHKKVSKHRVNIDTDNGDILFELDEDQDENVCWITEHGTPLMFSDPDEPTDTQISSSKKYFKDVETALWKGDYATVYSMIDRESFIDNYIIQELTMNIDGNFRKSNFLTLPKDGKLKMYFVWDFDLSLGNADYYGNPPGNGPKGWWVQDHGSWGRYQGWYYQLFKDPDFVDAVQKRWAEVLPDLKEIPAYIDKQVGIIGEEAVERNFAIWSFTDNGWWNKSRSITTYDAEISFLQDFYSERLDWIDTNLNAL